MSELKKCPVCGSGATQCWMPDDGFRHAKYITCENKDCPVYQSGFTKEQWQSRPLEDALRTENAKLRKALTKIWMLIVNPPLCFVELDPEVIFMANYLEDIKKISQEALK